MSGVHLNGRNDVLLIYSIVYDVKASDNEEKSAEMFMKYAQECFNVRNVCFSSLKYNFFVVKHEENYQVWYK